MNLSNQKTLIEEKKLNNKKEELNILKDENKLKMIMIFSNWNFHLIKIFMIII